MMQQRKVQHNGQIVFPRRDTLQLENQGSCRQFLPVEMQVSCLPWHNNERNPEGYSEVARAAPQHCEELCMMNEIPITTKLDFCDKHKKMQLTSASSSQVIFIFVGPGSEKTWRFDVRANGPGGQWDTPGPRATGCRTMSDSRASYTGECLP